MKNTDPKPNDLWFRIGFVLCKIPIEIEIYGEKESPQASFLACGGGEKRGKMKKEKRRKKKNSTTTPISYNLNIKISMQKLLSFY